MRKLTAVALVAAFAVAGCSTEKDSDTTSPPDVTTDGSATTTAGTDTDGTTGSTLPGTVVDDRAPGVTDTSVKVGIMYTDFTRVGPILGYDQGDYEAAYMAVIDDINANGGINGRTIDPVLVPVDPSATDGPTAACTKLAEDEQVFIAIGFVFDAAGNCLYNTHETLTIGGTQSAEALAEAKVGWWTLDAGNDLRAKGIQTLADEGAFTENLAVVSTTADQVFYESVVQPILEGAGITPLEVAYMDPTFDANQTYSDAQTIAERFSSEGADQVLMLSLGNIFPGGIVRTDWRPQLIFDLTNNAGVYTSDPTSDLSLMKGAIAAGLFDAGNFYDTLGSPTTECLALQEAAGLELVKIKDVPDGGSQQITASLIACGYVALLVAGLEAAGPELNYGTFTTAMNNLGDVMLPGSPNPWHFTAERPDGNPDLYLFEWDEATEMMVARV